MNPIINGRPVPDCLADLARQFVGAVARFPRGKRIIFIKRGNFFDTIGNCAVQAACACDLTYRRVGHVPVVGVSRRTIDRVINQLATKNYEVVMVGGVS